MRFFLVFVLTLTLASISFAEEAEAPAYWEYGLGVGYVHYEHYPAANQFANLFLPFPTFQYRGKIVRADDREGAHAYLLKSHQWAIEMAGAGYPALDSSKNEARQGMDNLPWMLALGPQVVYSPSKDLKFLLGAFQAISTDFQMTKFTGGLFQGKLSYQFPGEATFGKLLFTLKAGTKEFLANYYQVPADKATAVRPAYEAKGGFLSQEITYFQSFKAGKMAFYIGGSFENYSFSVNRDSPLHKAQSNFTYLAGVTYVLGESSIAAVPEEETSGVINRWRWKEPF